MSDDRTCETCHRTIPTGAVFCPEYGPAAGSRCPIFGAVAADEPGAEPSGGELPGVVATGTDTTEHAEPADADRRPDEPVTRIAGDDPEFDGDPPARPQAGGLGQPTQAVNMPPLLDEPPDAPPAPSEPGSGDPTRSEPSRSEPAFDDAPTSTIGATPVESSPTQALPMSPPRPPPPPAPGGAPAEAPGRGEPAPGSYPPPPAGGWTPSSGASGGRTTSPANVVAAIVALVGAALVAVGAFLPWLTTAADESVSGIDASDDAVILLALAGVGAVLAVLLLARMAPVVLKVLLIAVGVATAGVAVYDLVDINDLGDGVDLGAGLFVVVAGAVVLVVAGILASTRSRAGR